MKFIIILFFLVVHFLHSQTWIQQTSPVATDLTSAWACTGQVCWMCGPGGIAIRTTNSGVSWNLANSGLAGHDFYTITALNANICIVGAGDGSIWRTSNGGLTWTNIPLTPPGVFINVVHFFNQTHGFAQSDPVGGFWGYWITTNAGLNWSAGPVPIPASASEAGWNNDYCALDTSYILWGTNLNKIWKGSLRGAWNSFLTPGNGLPCFTFNDYLNGASYFGTGPVYFTNDGGTTWNPTIFTPNGNPFIIKGLPYTGLMFLGTTTTIYRSTNNGVTWGSQLNLPANSGVYSLTLIMEDPIIGWAGTQGGKIFRYSQFVGIDPNNTNTADKLILEQNYPNPFNPSTTIKYALPNASFVTLNIYDAVGNLIKTVVSGNQIAGNHVENVDMSSFASGIYFYCLNAGSFTETKKMTLIK